MTTSAGSSTTACTLSSSVMSTGTFISTTGAESTATSNTHMSTLSTSVAIATTTSTVSTSSTFTTTSTGTSSTSTTTTAYTPDSCRNSSQVALPNGTCVSFAAGQ
ncbi:unnamed protein product, partial [Rotaria magnacalcarata]